MEELSRNKIDISLFPETTLDETFPSQQFKIVTLKCQGEIELNMRGRLYFTSVKILLVIQKRLQVSPITEK